MIKKLTGDRVSLVPATPEYAEQLAEWLNDLEVAVPLGAEAWRLTTAESVRQELSDSQHSFVILANADDAPIGRCSLFGVSQVDRNAMLGIFIGDKRYWNLGMGGDALNLLLEYAFNLLNLNSVMLGVFEFNVRALRCYKRLGFREIGRRRAARLIAGRYYDGIFLDLLASEFRGNLVGSHLPATGGPARPLADQSEPVTPDSAPGSLNRDR